ncbi:hypothetical protein [Enterococcus phage VFW]|nr:hypothetical protein [Enterococcus phage VFW]
MKLTNYTEQYAKHALESLRHANNQLNTVQTEDSDVMAIQFEIAKIMNKIRETYLEENK